MLSEVDGVDIRAQIAVFKQANKTNLADHVPRSGRHSFSDVKRYGMTDVHLSREGLPI